MLQKKSVHNDNMSCFQVLRRWNLIFRRQITDGGYRGRGGGWRCTSGSTSNKHGRGVDFPEAAARYT
jgi:hypothetical protein